MVQSNLRVHTVVVLDRCLQMATFKMRIKFSQCSGGTHGAFHRDCVRKIGRVVYGDEGFVPIKSDMDVPRR